MVAFFDEVTSDRRSKLIDAPHRVIHGYECEYPRDLPGEMKLTHKDIFRHAPILPHPRDAYPVIRKLFSHFHPA
jgi:hypothetical protein